LGRLIGLKRRINDRVLHHLVSWLWLRMYHRVHLLFLLFDSRELLMFRLGTRDASLARQLKRVRVDANSFGLPPREFSIFGNVCPSQSELLLLRKQSVFLNQGCLDL
jgi:hypothetical protein